MFYLKRLFELNPLMGMCGCRIRNYFILLFKLKLIHVITIDKQNSRQSSDSHDSPRADPNNLKQSSDNIGNIEKVFECVVTGDRQLPPAL